MRRIFYLLISILSLSLPEISRAQDVAVDTIRVGMYITNLHDLDFKSQEYEVSFWFWINLKSSGVQKEYASSKIELLKSIEIPESREQKFDFIDTTTLPDYILAKFSARIKDSLRVTWFPFDRQRLRFSVESGLYDINTVFIEIDSNDILPQLSKIDSRFVGNGWRVEDRKIFTKISRYYTRFGNENLGPVQEYSAAVIEIDLLRKPWGIFFKLFLGMYISFFIAFVSFFIHFESIESRLSISVGALFAVIGNKYIVESILPETNDFNLVDWLHSLSLLCILAIIFVNTLSIRLVKKEQVSRSIRLDNRSAKWIFITYFLINLILVIIPNLF